MTILKKLLYIVSALGLLVLLFVIFSNSIPSQTPREKSLDTLPELEPPNTPVAVETIQHRDLVQKITSTGVFKAKMETAIVSQVAGQVRRLNVEEGRFVSKGDTILELDAERYAIAYLQAKDQMTRALREYASIALLSGQLDRGHQARDLIETKADTTNINDVEALSLFASGTPKEWIASTTGLTHARLVLKQADLDHKNAVITAPFAGAVTEVEATLGTWVTQGQSLMQLLALDPLLLEVSILESELRLLHVGAQATIVLHAYPDDPFVGAVKAISPVVDSESGTCRILIQMANPDRRIKPGMFARLEIGVEAFQQRLLIPRDALLTRDDRKLVFVHQDGLAQWRYVKTGLENDDFIEVTEGVEAGEELIVSGHYNLAHDAKVVVIQR